MNRHLSRNVARQIAFPVACAAAIISIIGCSTDPEPKPLGADQFYRPTDRDGALPPGPAPREERPAPQSDSAQKSTAEGMTFVAEQVKSPVPIEPATLPSNGSSTPAPVPAPAPTFAPGQYLSVGGVVAEVNGNPIYADSVLRSISAALAGRAKDLELPKFRAVAASEVNRQVDDLIRAEVEYAAASRNTSSDDKKLADHATEAWRTRKITESKGSIEETRARFREQGQSFDDASKEQNRLNLVRVYYSKKLFPRIQVTANDMRRYYEQNRDALFTERDNLTFRLVKASAKDLGSDDAAKQKITDIAARAARGEDFIELAKFNQDQTLLRAQGLVGPIDRGAYVLEEVEKALWSLSPGQITPVIKIGDAYYIAKLEGKKIGRVQNFEEDAVQKKMQESLRGEQFSKMRREMEVQLRKESVVSKNPQMIETTIEMAVQNYANWRGQ